MAREATKALIVLLAALLPAASFAQAEPVDAQAARSYVWSAFLTGAAPTILSEDVQIGTSLRQRLSLPPHASRDAVYRALIALTEGKTIRVTVEPAKVAAFDRAALLVEAGKEVRLVVQYDLRANNISFIGLPERKSTAGEWTVG